MRRLLGVGPFTGILILVGGLLLLNGCRTLGPSEEIPVTKVLPGGYPLYFSLDIADGGGGVTELLIEQEQPGVIVKTWQKGVRLWGALPAPGEGSPLIVFEGDVPRFKSSLGLTFSREWNKSDQGDWWEDSQGGQIAFTGGHRLYYSRGGMDQLRARENGLLSPETGGVFPRDMERSLGEGSAVLWAPGSGLMEAFFPIPPGVNLTCWILRLDREAEEWRGSLVLFFEEEGQARVLGTTLKLLFLRTSRETGGNDPSGVQWTGLFLERLKQTRVNRRNAELTLGELVFSNQEFSDMMKEVMRQSLALP